MWNGRGLGVFRNVVVIMPLTLKSCNDRAGVGCWGRSKRERFPLPFFLVFSLSPLLFFFQILDCRNFGNEKVRLLPTVFLNSTSFFPVVRTQCHRVTGKRDKNGKENGEINGKKLSRLKRPLGPENSPRKGNLKSALSGTLLYPTL